MKLPLHRGKMRWLAWAAGGAVAVGLGALLAGCIQNQDKITPISAPAPIKTPAATAPSAPPVNPALATFHQVIEPILKDNCYDCHGNGESRAGVAFDQLKTEDQILHNPDLWLKVLKNTRSGIMPAGGNPRLSAQDQATLDNWIKFSAFGIDPDNLDPGRVTLRRLNRTEYHNTIKDLLGVDFDVNVEFPPDDTGYGFDDIGDVLTISPMRLEKFLQAAQTIVDRAVPATTYALPVQTYWGKEFLESPPAKDLTKIGHKPGDFMDFYTPQEVTHTYQAIAAGDYHIKAEMEVDGTAAYDPAQCTVIVKSDGQEVAEHGYVWYDCEFYSDDYVVHWEKGTHQVSFELQPLLPDMRSNHTKMDFKVSSVTVEGPLDPKDWPHAPNYARFFPRDVPPADAAGRRQYAREILAAFATKAFRRPASDTLVNGLVDVAEKSYSQPGGTFEAGVSRAMAAVLATPRFLFHIESATPPAPGQPFAQLDEYSLASRLSYFLWSTLPDDELLQLAGTGQLRNHLEAQVQRMLADPRSEAFVDNFAGQWLQSRDLPDLPINAPEILAREGFQFKRQLTPDLRAAIQQETMAYFGYVVHNDRSILELLDSNYAFRNETLANYYTDDGLPPGSVTGPEFRKVELPPTNPRGGGVLTMASTLLMTSNPTRTSPVKRGKWILENILGAPAPPPPPNIPPLEDAAKLATDHTPTQREVLALHRQNPLCASCHDRMDPLGLALENFNALGLYRTQELSLPIDATGTLSTGESFQNIAELKHILVTNHREEFYRTLTEKLLTYAVGRGMEYYDVPTIDKIVDRLDHADGRFSALLLGVIESAPFQERRPLANPLKTDSPASSQLTQTTPAHVPTPP